MRKNIAAMSLAILMLVTTFCVTSINASEKRDQTREYMIINEPYWERGFPIRYSIDGSWGGAQSFMLNSSLSHLTRASVYIRKFGNPEFDLTVELRNGSVNGTLVDTVVFPANNISSNWSWVDVIFDDIYYPAVNESYFIVMPPPSGVNTSFGYEWAYATDDQYVHGDFWFTRNSGNLWSTRTAHEFTFRVFGY